MDALAELEALIGDLDDKGRSALDQLLASELQAPWLPTPGPQAEAYYSDADLLLYGGAAGGGKTDLIVGLALGEHRRSVIFRRSYGELSDIAERFLTVLGTREGYSASPQPRYRKQDILVEFGALEQPGSHLAWRGRAHDLICFDEGGELSQEKIAFVLGWLRSTDANQRCRAVIASNPPTGGEGNWLLVWFAPWLDPLFPNPAKPGELRWAFECDGETMWVDGPGVTIIEGEEYQHLSRTFIPALLNDNPYLRETGYRARIQSLPEPLRSQLLKGDFLAGREDHAWQVIPTAWVEAANVRWNKAQDRKRTMLALAADVAGEGADRTAIACLHEDCWFAPIVHRRGSESADPALIPLDTANLMLMTQRDDCDLSVDGTGGWGSGVRSHLKNNHGLECASLVFSAGSNRKTHDGKLGYKNLRSDMYWGFREALDPESGDEIKLPPDPRLMAELTAARYTLRGTDILIESKDEIRARLGGSPDDADAVVMAWHRRKSAIKPVNKEPLRQPRYKPARGVGSWMGRF